MELKDLAGEHVLDAVDFSNEQVKTWGDEFESCNVMRFRLDGIVYTAVEDPSDGYRSSMRELDVGEWKMANCFEGMRVVGRHRANCTYGGSADILELIAISTGKTVLEVGTDNTSDYYPSYVANFDPSALQPKTK